MQSGKMRKQGLTGKRHAGHLPGHAMRVAMAEAPVPPPPPVKLMVGAVR